jgi:hypothetical protein
VFTSGTYPLSFVTHIFHNGQPGHGGDRNLFEVMISTLPKGTRGSVATLLARFGDFVDRIYPIELEIKDTTDTDRSASYLDLLLEIDSEGRLRTKLYDKRDNFKFPL